MNYLLEQVTTPRRMEVFLCTIHFGRSAFTWNLTPERTGAAPSISYCSLRSKTFEQRSGTQQNFASGRFEAIGNVSMPLRTYEARLRLSSGLGKWTRDDNDDAVISMRVRMHELQLPLDERQSSRDADPLDHDHLPTLR